NPYSENYFISFQRQFGKNTVLDASYTGSQGHHLLVLLAANPGNPALCLSLSAPADLAPGTPTCGPFVENLVYTRSNGQVVMACASPSVTTSAPMSTSPAWATRSTTHCSSPCGTAAGD